MIPLAIGSLFSGIGGLDLSVEAHFASLGFDARTVWQVEHDAFCNTILARHFPGAARLVRDVRAAGAANLAPIDALCAGFPCQPVSLAGPRKAREDARWLWPECARIIGELRPRYVFLENVPGLLTADDGRAFGDVLGSLAALGYDAEWDCLRASDVGAPHRRERWFLLAYCDGERQPQPQGVQPDESRRAVDGRESAVDAAGAGAPAAQQRGRRVADRGPARPLARGDGECVADARRVDGDGRAYLNARRGPDGDAPRRDEGDRHVECGDSGRGERSGAAQSVVGRDSHGLPDRLDAPRWPAGRGAPQHAWEPPRTAAKVPHRHARLKALGNAVVWQQAALAWRVLWQRMEAVGCQSGADS